MSKWNVLKKVTGWVAFGIVEAENEPEAIKLGERLEYPDRWDPETLYDILETATGPIEVDEAPARALCRKDSRDECIRFLV